MADRRARWRARTAALRHDRGSASVEWAIGALVLISLFLLAGHAFTWGTARMAAQKAAGHAVQTSRVLGGTQTTGRDDATALLDELAGGNIRNRQVTVERTATQTTVTITGSVPTLIDGLTLPVKVTRTAPTERYQLP
jgi:Flp pilus assembly protein TadG